MLGIGGAIGTIGAGSIETAMQIGADFKKPGEPALLALFRLIVEDPSGLARQFWDKFPPFRTGIGELTDFVKYFWAHTISALGFTPTPDPTIYMKRFFHV